MFGEDVARKGGVYGVTQGLQEKFGAARVFDTLLDEQTILGLAIGMAHNGFVPMPEIQFLAYLHNAEDQIRGEAATLSFFQTSNIATQWLSVLRACLIKRDLAGISIMTIALLFSPIFQASSLLVRPAPRTHQRC